MHFAASTSPAFTATASASRARTDMDNSFDLDTDMDGAASLGLHGTGMPDINDLFNFDEYDSANDTTASPNRTPSPSPADRSPVALTGSPLFNFAPELDFSFDFMNEKGSDPFPSAGPSSFNTSFTPAPVPAPQPELDFVVKSEPIEWPEQPIADMSIQATATPATLPANPDPAAAEPLNFNGLPLDQQVALQQLMFNIMAYQSQFGMQGGMVAPQTNAPPAPQPTTVEPSMVFSNNAGSSRSGFASTSALPMATPQFTPSSGSTPGLTVGTSSSSAPSVSPAPPAAASAAAEEAEDDALIAIDAHGSSRSTRADSAFSFSGLGGDDGLDAMAKLDRLAPLSSIFSAGKGKGGKKGGGLSSVVRQEDEDIDDDDSWRPSPEEYKKLSSKEKRQLRNKLSARAFRNRRKDYIGTLEGHIKERDGVIDEMRAELMTSRTENQDLRKELAALKASTLGILHPKSAVNATEPPAVFQAFSLSPNIPTVAAPSRKAAPTPVFNPRKDVGIDSKTRWGNENLFGGGSTICHTILTPDTAAAVAPYNMPRENINPRLVPKLAPVMRTSDLQAPAEGNVGADSFAEWSEANAFSLRSMDSYRMQMWGRLAREAASDKAGLAGPSRPKFLVEPVSKEDKQPEMSKKTAAQLAAVSAAHITSKLAQSFWSAFQSPGTTVDADKLTAVVTGRSKLRVVPMDANSEKAQLAQDDLIAALGGLKLQAGKEAGWRERSDARVRDDPLRALGGMFGLGMGMGAAARA